MIEMELNKSGGSSSSANTNSVDALTSLLGKLAMGSGLGGLFGGLYNTFNPGKSPYDEASRIYGQIPGATQPFFQPYIDAGRSAMGDLQGQYGQLTGQTGDVYNRLAGGYQESPGYKRQLEQAMGGVNRAAAAGGMLGTPAAQLQAADVGQNVASRDFGDYMNRVQSLYGMGLGGLGEINKMGYGASTNYADMLGNIMAQQGGTSALSQALQNQQRSQGISQAASGAGTLAGGLMEYLPTLLSLLGL
jgi:hypothetical protein